MAAMAAQGRLLITGGPGAGKTTLLRKRLLEAGTKWSEDPKGNPFPVYARLGQASQEKEVLTPRVWLKSWLPKHSGVPEAAFQHWAGGKILWLLDGGDEVRDTGDRAALWRELAAMGRDPARAGDSVVVTARPGGVPEASVPAGWSRLEMAGLSPGQAEAVIGKWSVVLEKKEGKSLDKQGMVRAFGKGRGLGAVLTNPLLLTLAVLFYKNRMRLPDHRWEFYSYADQTLRDSWLSYRASGASDYVPRAAYLTPLLEELALGGMREGRTVFSGAELRSNATATLRARGYGQEAIDVEVEKCEKAARDLIGVIHETAPDQFGFLHLTFQEYFAALALRDRSGEAEETVGRYWDHPDWQEVWALYALGVGDEGRHRKLIETIVASGHELDRDLKRPLVACVRLVGVGEAGHAESWGLIEGDVRAAVAGRLGQAVRRKVLEAFGAWERPAPRWVLDACIEMVKGGAYPERDAAARVLGSAAATDVAFRKELLALLGDKDSNVRSAAARSLSGAAATDFAVRKELVALLGDKEGQVRYAAARSLSGAGATDVAVRKELVALLGDKEGQVRYAAAMSLSGAAAVDEEVREALLKVLRSGDAASDDSAYDGLAEAAVRLRQAEFEGG
jgi:hypothetical protein